MSYPQGGQEPRNSSSSVSSEANSQKVLLRSSGETSFRILSESQDRQKRRRTRRQTLSSRPPWIGPLESDFEFDKNDEESSGKNRNKTKVQERPRKAKKVEPSSSKAKVEEPKPIRNGSNFKVFFSPRPQKVRKSIVRKKHPIRKRPSVVSDSVIKDTFPEDRKEGDEKKDSGSNKEPEDNDSYEPSGADAKRRSQGDLQKDLLPDLSPERAEKAKSNIRKLLEGFIEASNESPSAKAPEGTEEEVPRNASEIKFNLANAAKKLVGMAQQGDWIAFEQAFKAVERYLDEPGNAGEALPKFSHPSTGSTVLMFAAMENRLSLIQRILAIGCDVNQKNDEGYTALHMAAMFSRDEVVKTLLENRSDFRSLGGLKSQSVIHLSVGRSTTQAYQILKELMRVCPSEMKLVEDADGVIPLFVAIEANNFNVCKYLLSDMTREQIEKTKPPRNDTCLHLAARSGDNELVKLFIEFGANIDAVNKDGQTCLHIAALRGDQQLMRTLFMARANPTVTDLEDRTPLHLAAERGHTTVVEFLADTFKASVFDRAKDGSTLMHLSALHGHSETTMMLYKKGVPLLMPNRFGARGIHTAAMRGHVSVISSLVSKGEDVDCLTNDNYTALHLAVQEGKAVVVEALLGHGAKVHIKGGKIGETALHIAARIDESRGLKCIKMLLKSGADPNMAMSDGKTALHVAAENGGLNSIRYLLQNGADVMVTDKTGETALHKACHRCQHPSVRELLAFVTNALGDPSDFVQRQNSVGETALHHAGKVVKGNLHFKDEDVAIIDELMEHKSNAMIQTNTTKEGVLHYIANSGNLDTLKTLLKHLVSAQIHLVVNQQSATGWSPLCIAASKGHLQIVDILLENSARVDVFDHEGKTSLHLASEGGHVDICRRLIEKNAFVNSRTKNGMTSMHFAAQKGHLHLIKMLVTNYEASVDAASLKKQTPLHLAALSGMLEVCRLLMDMGASLDSVDEMGQKPIHLAATSDKPEVILLFLSARPSLVSSTTKDGSTCAHIAARKGSAMVIQELLKFDRSVVLASRNKITDSTPFHIATEGGHLDVVRILLAEGASIVEENKSGFTPVIIAAKFGHTQIIDEFAKQPGYVESHTKKTENF